MNRLNKTLFALVAPVVTAGGVYGGAVGAELVDETGLLDESRLAAVYALAKKHDLGYLIAGALRAQGAALPSGKLGAELERAEMTAVYRVRNNENEQGRVKRCLEDAGIPFILLKGAVTRGYYPEAWMRTSSDIDILVPRDKLDAVVEAITSGLDYEISTIEAHDASLYARSGVHLDVHTLFDGDGEGCENLTRTWASASTEGGMERFMTAEDFYLYHVAHMAKHMKNGGCGIRPFIDLYLIRKMTKRDEATVAELLQSLLIDRFERAAVALADAWMTGGDTSGLSALEEYVLTGGVYGSTDQYVAARHRGRRSKLGYIMRRIFMPYAQLKERHPVLVKHPILTPVMQVWRWLSVLDPARLKRTGRELVSNARVDGEKITSVEELFVSLGI